MSGSRSTIRPFCVLMYLLTVLLPTGVHAQEPPPNPALDQHILIMQEHMLAMHHLMNEIEAAKDDKTREALKEKMRQMIKDHMKQQRGHKP
ncbi:MAG: hypothetical protein RIQ52_635 [Pseudomonadota bacterium]